MPEYRVWLTMNDPDNPSGPRRGYFPEVVTANSPEHAISIGEPLIRASWQTMFHYNLQEHIHDPEFAGRFEAHQE